MNYSTFHCHAMKIERETAANQAWQIRCLHKHKRNEQTTNGIIIWSYLFDMEIAYVKYLSCEENTVPLGSNTSKPELKNVCGNNMSVSLEITKEMVRTNGFW